MGRVRRFLLRQSTAAHGRAEYASAAFRKVREGSATLEDFRLALAQIKADAATGHLQYFPLTESIIDRVEAVFAAALATTYLRATDALHLATATEQGFTEIHPTTSTSSLPHRCSDWSGLM